MRRTALSCLCLSLIHLSLTQALAAKPAEHYALSVSARPDGFHVQSPELPERVYDFTCRAGMLTVHPPGAHSRNKTLVTEAVRLSAKAVRMGAARTLRPGRNDVVVSCGHQDVMFTPGENVSLAFVP